jgi:membrane-associated protein
MLVAAILGNILNYWLGHKLGHKVFAKENSKLFNKKYLEKTREFYAKHGGKTIILTRFMPIIRSFAPFVAGMGSMHYKTFMIYNLVGGFLWVTILTFAGYFFGGIPLIKNHFEAATYIIIIVSLLPAVFEFIKHKMSPEKSKTEKESTSYQEIEKTFKKEHLND